MPIVDIRGPLIDGDDRKFDLFAEALPRAVVRLESPGGQLWAGLRIGGTIARKGYATFVRTGQVCASACGFAWLAGQPRGKAPSAMVGSHTGSARLPRGIFRLDDTGPISRIPYHGAYAQVNGRTEQTGAANAMVGAYMTNLHFGYPAVVFATSAPPDDMLWLTANTARESGITYEVRDEVETTFWAAPACADRPSTGRGAFLHLFAGQTAADAAEKRLDSGHLSKGHRRYLRPIGHL